MVNDDLNVPYPAMVHGVVVLHDPNPNLYLRPVKQRMMQSWRRRRRIYIVDIFVCLCVCYTLFAKNMVKTMNNIIDLFLCMYVFFGTFFSHFSVLQKTRS